MTASRKRAEGYANDIIKEAPVIHPRKATSSQAARGRTRAAGRVSRLREEAQMKGQVGDAWLGSGGVLVSFGAARRTGGLVMIFGGR